MESVARERNFEGGGLLVVINVSDLNILAISNVPEHSSKVLFRRRSYQFDKQLHQRQKQTLSSTEPFPDYTLSALS